MQRWEYKVVSLRKGHYTDALNEYGRDGWELVSVASEDREIPAPERGSVLPMPRAFGRLGDAAAKLNTLGTGDSTEAQGATSPTTLLWVLRRPLSDD